MPTKERESESRHKKTPTSRPSARAVLRSIHHRTRPAAGGRSGLAIAPVRQPHPGNRLTHLAPLRTMTMTTTTTTSATPTLRMRMRMRGISKR